MLIDSSYFVGSLTIAQTGLKAVDDNLDNYINRWEPIIMEAAIGIDFYQAFLDGLDITPGPIEQRWLDLLMGFAFTDLSGIKRRFGGFAGDRNAQTIIAAQRTDLHIYGGFTPGFPTGGYQYTNANLSGWTFDVEIFGAGTIQPIVDWNYKPGGGIILVDTGYTVAQDEHWILHFTGKKIVSVPSGAQNLQSLLAGFIYYEYMVGLNTQNTGIGMVKSKGENSETASGAFSMVAAFNDAVKQVEVLWEFLRVDQNKVIKVYPEFDYRQVYSYGYGFNYGYSYYGYDQQYSFKRINTFGI